MKTKNYVLEINTTAYEEENFYVITNINENKLNDSLNIIIEKLREETNNEYINEDITNEVNKLYPFNLFSEITIDYISI